MKAPDLTNKELQEQILDYLKTKKFKYYDGSNNIACTEQMGGCMYCIFGLKENLPDDNKINCTASNYTNILVELFPEYYI